MSAYPEEERREKKIGAAPTASASAEPSLASAATSASAAAPFLPAASGQRESLVAGIIQGTTIPTFVINRHHRVVQWNRALELLTGLPALTMVGSNQHWRGFYPTERPCMADLVVDGTAEARMLELYGDQGRSSSLLEGSLEGEAFFPNLGTGGRWLFFTASPLRNAVGETVGAIETLQDVTARKNAEAELEDYRNHLEQLVAARTAELQQANESLQVMNQRLEQTHEQLLQSEKMASIGQLAAGVAHEINNPVGFVNSNLGSLQVFVRAMTDLLAVYQRHEALFAADSLAQAELAAKKQEVDIDYILEDISSLIDESKEGLARVRKIVLDLRDFSHVSADAWEWVDLHKGLDTTLNIVINEIKYKAEVIKHYGELPMVECLAQELNQVFMNLLVNASHAIAERGTITISTGVDGEQVWIDIEDTGVGIAPENLARIFDPFFTTKPVGKGTGLGLAITYGVVKKHRGSIEVFSEPGKGTRFHLRLPITQTAAAT